MLVYPKHPDPVISPLTEFSVSVTFDSAFMAPSPAAHVPARTMSGANSPPFLGSASLTSLVSDVEWLAHRRVYVSVATREKSEVGKGKMSLKHAFEDEPGKFSCKMQTNGRVRVCAFPLSFILFRPDLSLSLSLSCICVGSIDGKKGKYKLQGYIQAVVRPPRSSVKGEGSGGGG